MIIKIEEKFDVSPEWFEEQSKKDAVAAWQEKLCELLSVYKLHDVDGAIKAGEILKFAGFKEECINNALE